MSTRNDPTRCKRCDGTGEEFRPDLRHYTDGPWAPCIGCHGYGIEQSDESMRHAAAVLGEYWRNHKRWPVAFKSDVEVHDMEELCDRDPDLCFGWVLRESGSALMFPEDIPPRGFSADYIRQMGREGQLCYWWDGRKLRLVGGDILAEHMEYERRRIERNERNHRKTA